MPNILTIVIYTACLLRHILADFDCLCNYNVETNVLNSPSTNGQNLGTLYEFDCKPLYSPGNIAGINQDFLAVQYQNKIGYIQTNDQIQEQICPGSPSPNDVITTTSTRTLSTAGTTTTSTTTTTTTPKPSTILLTSTISTGTQPQSTFRSPTILLTSPTPKVLTVKPTISTRLSSTVKPTSSAKQKPTTSMTKPSSTTRTKSSTTVKTTPLGSKQSVTTSIYRSIQPKTTQQTLPVFNVSGTPLRYIGIGYNLLRGNPDGNQYGSTNTDEGLNFDKRILQITRNNQGAPVQAEYTVNITACEKETRASIIFDEKSYQEQLFGLIKLSSTHPDRLTNASFVLSPEFKRLYPNGLSDSNIYRDITTTCKAGFARYKLEQSNNGMFSVTKEFAAAVCQLPLTYDIVSYIKFLEIWGTSVIMASQLGKRTTKRFHISTLQAFQHVQKVAPNLVTQEGNYMGFSSSLSIDTDNYTVSQTPTTAEFGTIYSTIDIGGRSTPITIDIVPISDVLDSMFWKQLRNSGILNRICPSTFDLATTQKNIYTALESYASALLAPTVKSNPLRIPVTWPVGTYGLMKTNTGCPSSNVTWAEGWRKQDTEDHDAANHYSSDIYSYMAGQFDINNLRTDFCIKTVSTSTQYDRPWPKGQYCLLQYNNCPTGFQRGYLLWDDEDGHNHNAYGGTMPTGSYNGNTKIYYCCRTDGQVSNPISLPTDTSFILLRYGPACQEVYNMKVKQIYVRWDDDDTGNFDARWGTHPFDDGGSKDHRLYFCHYQANRGSAFIPGIVG